MMDQLFIDARMIDSSGIGRVIRNIIFSKEFNHSLGISSVKIILKKDASSGILDQLPSSWDCIYTDTDIYSIREQLAFLRWRMNSNSIWWSPHYNIPVLGTSKLLVTVHDLIHVARPDLFPAKLERLYAHIMFSQVVNRARYIACDSQFTADELTSRFNVDAKKIRVIPINLDHQFLLNDEDLTEEGDAQPFFLYVGNVKPHKNLKRTLLAFSAIKDELALNFLIAGEREGFRHSETELGSLLDDLGDRVHFTGFVSDAELRKLYARAEFLVFPSEYEGFGLPPLEAMGMQCPVVGSDIPAVREVCGDAILYFDPLSINDIGNKLSLMAKDNKLRKYYQLNGSDKAKAYLSHKTATNYAELINKMAAEF